MTWIALGAAAISAAGAVGSAALSKRGGGMPAIPQMAPDQKTAATKPTADAFKTPPPVPQQPAQVAMTNPAQPLPQPPAAPTTSQMPPSFVSQSVPQDAQLADFLKILQRGEY